MLFQAKIYCTGQKKQQQKTKKYKPKTFIHLHNHHLYYQTPDITKTSHLSTKSGNALYFGSCLVVCMQIIGMCKSADCAY